jgi:hypothetical protein
MDSTTLSTYEPAPLVEFPNSLYNYIASDFVQKKQRSLYNQIREEIAATQDISNKSLEALVFYPRVLEYVLLNADLSHDTQSRLAKESPQAALNSIISNYQSPAAKVLELSIMTQPEYVCKLLLWAHEAKCTLRFPLPMYYPILYGDFYWAHYFYSRKPLPLFYERMVHYHLNYKEISASSVLCLACLNYLTSFTPAQVLMLSADPAIAFQAAVLFPDRANLSALLMEATMSPQWAYHILTAIPNLPADLRDICMLTLQHSPPWLLEYVHQTKMLQNEPDRAHRMLLKSLDKGHPLADDMRQGISFLH